MALNSEKELLRRSSFFGNLKPSDKKLDLHRTRTQEIFLIRSFVCLFVCLLIDGLIFHLNYSSYQLLPQIALSWVEIRD